MPQLKRRFRQIRNMGLTGAGLLFLLSCHGNFSPEAMADYARLKEGFANPPASARPKVYWWWLNGYTDTTRMKVELQAMKDAGIGGMDIFEIGARPEGVVPAGPPFMSEKSLEHIVFAIREAGRLGLEVGLNLSSSWNAGGSWIGPEHAAKSLYCSTLTVHGGEKGEDAEHVARAAGQVRGSGAGSGADKIKLPFPEIPRTDRRGRPLLIEFAEDGKPVYRQEVAVLAVPVRDGATHLDTAHILNLSSFFDPETELLNWQAPAGEWNIYRYVCSNSGEALKLPSPNSMGPIIDHFDSTATRAHFMYFIDKLKPLLGDFREAGLKNLYLASFEATGTVWTSSMAQAFHKINGYDLYKFLPWFFDKDSFEPAAAESFKRDFDLTVSELMIRNHYRKGSEIARSYGLNLISESGGPGPPLHNVPVEAIKALGALDVPRGEFWMPSHRRLDGTADSVDLLMLVKEIAAAAHIYGKKAAELEAFTSFQNWREGPGDMKPVGDRAFCEGMNRAVIHGFTHNPEGTGFPGIVYGAGTHYNVKTTWWKQSRAFNDYLARISYIFQEADFTADVLYYYGDRTPNFATPKNTRFAVGSGYDYEIINTEILLRDLEMKDGKLTLPGGAQFSVLSLGEITGNIPGIWEKLRKLAGEGAVITGARPAVLPEALPGGSWLEPDPAAFGKDDLAAARGKILFGVPALQLLQALGIPPDLDYPDKGTARLDFQHSDVPFMDYIHYRKGTLDFYFVRNTSDRWLSRECTFRQMGRAPEIWDPVSGTVVPVTIYREEGPFTHLPLTLPPYGSCFVVFAAPSEKSHYHRLLPGNSHPPLLTYTEHGPEFLKAGTYELESGRGIEAVKADPGIRKISGEWLLKFPEGWGAPDSARFPELISWTESEQEGIRYFSGTATYEKSFRFREEREETGPDSAPARRIYLDLGEVSEVAEVWLNDRRLGIAWTPPYRFDVTGIIQPGENTLTLQVANTWSNRITGDAITGEKYTHTNLSGTSSRGTPWAETPLMKSGLLGPVTIRTLSSIAIPD